MKPLATKFKRNKAQALLELSIFGSIMLMLLGVLINYALRYNAQQRIEQKAFRKALNESYQVKASIPYFDLILGNHLGITDFVHSQGTSSYTVVEDVHIPDPGNPWGVGQVIPVSASASIPRNERFDTTAEWPSELPVSVFEINGNVKRYKTAGMRLEPLILNEPFARNVYGTVFGMSDVIEKYTLGLGPCLVTDNADGQIVDYNYAYRQCRMIYDPLAYTAERIKELGPETIDTWSKGGDAAIAQTLGMIWTPSVFIPQYCRDGYRVHEDGTPVDEQDNRDVNGTEHAERFFDRLGELVPYRFWGGKWAFPHLDELFQNAGYATVDKRIMGLQPNVEYRTHIDNQLQKWETPTENKTEDRVSSVNTVKREVLYVNRDGVDPNGVPRNSAIEIPYGDPSIPDFDGIVVPEWVPVLGGMTVLPPIRIGETERQAQTDTLTQTLTVGTGQEVPAEVVRWQTQQ